MIYIPIQPLTGFPEVTSRRRLQIDHRIQTLSVFVRIAVILLIFDSIIKVY
jgi:hypothetical protein